MKYIGLKRPEVSLTLTPAEVNIETLINNEKISELESSSINNSDIPIGGIIQSMINDELVGFTDCDGKALNKTKFSKLYSIIGDKFHPLANDTLKIEDIILADNPYKNQFYINFETEQLEKKEILLDSNLSPINLSFSSILVTKNKCFIFGGEAINKIYKAEIDEDGNLGAFQEYGMIFDYRGAYRGIVLSIKNKGYILGSESNTGDYTKIYTFTILEDGNITQPILNTYTFPSQMDSQYTIIKNRIYFFGGFSGNKIYYTTFNEAGEINLNSIQEYDTLPLSIRLHNVIHTRKYIYLFGSYDNPTTYMYCEIRNDGSLGPWSVVYNFENTGSCSYYVTNKNVYLFGGFENSTKIISFDIDKNGFLVNKKVTTTTTLLGHGAAFLATSKYFYILGGATGTRTGNQTNRILKIPLTYKENNSNFFIPEINHPESSLNYQIKIN